MKKKILLIIIVILCVICLKPTKEENINNKNYNVYIKQNGSYVSSNSNTLPTIGYILNTTQSSCTSGGTISQDFMTREVSITVNKQDKCNLYFDEYQPNIQEIFNDARYDNTTTNIIDNGSITVNNVTCTNTVAYDGTDDNNIRYVGASPCNYVTLPGQSDSWRIIGIMNNISPNSTSTSTKESRLKVVRATSLGNYSWDTSANGTNSGNGYNDWSNADLKTELNGDYLNTTLTTNQTWYNGRRNSKNASYNPSNGLKAQAQAIIGDAYWSVGGYANSTYIPVTTLYTAERSSSSYNNSWATKWTGKVALPYPSDVAYAVGGTVRSTCLAANLRTYSSNSCNTNSWIYQLGTNTRFLTPSTNNNNYVTYRNNTFIATNAAYNAYATFPTVYLLSNVVISGGNGTQSSPYTLSTSS